MPFSSFFFPFQNKISWYQTTENRIFENIGFLAREILECPNSSAYGSSGSVDIVASGNVGHQKRVIKKASSPLGACRTIRCALGERFRVSTGSRDLQQSEGPCQTFLSATSQGTCSKVTKAFCKVCEESELGADTDSLCLTPQLYI